MSLPRHPLRPGEREGPKTELWASQHGTEVWSLWQKSLRRSFSEGEIKWEVGKSWILGKENVSRKKNNPALLGQMSWRPRVHHWIILFYFAFFIFIFQSQPTFNILYWFQVYSSVVRQSRTLESAPLIFLSHWIFKMKAIGHLSRSNDFEMGVGDKSWIQFGFGENGTGPWSIN